jgi:type II secretory pathway component PulF
MATGEKGGHGSGGLSAEEAAQFGEQVAGLARAGLPLASGLRALGEEFPRGRLRSMLGSLSGRLEGGASLSEAIGAEGRGLPAALRGLVLAGERTGRLGDVLGRFAGYSQIGGEVRRQLWLSLAYPLIAASMAIVLFVFILAAVIGGNEDGFRSFGLQVSSLTKFLMDLASALRTSGLRIAEGLGALGVVAAVVMATIGPAGRRGVLGRLPLIGPVWRWTSLAEFCHLLGLLLESELPLAEAVPLAGDGVADADVRAAARGIARDLDGGDTLALAVGHRPYFPAGLGSILAWAEQHEALASTLHVVAEMFEARARSQAAFASMVFGALTVLMILTGILAVLFGVVAPMIQLIQKLSG